MHLLCRDGLKRVESITSLVHRRYGKQAEFSVTITVQETPRWNKFLETTSLFMANYLIVFNEAVIQSHKYLIRTTPYDFGKLRSGWTSFLKKHNIDYSTAMLDTSLIGAKPPRPDVRLMQEGETLSSFVEKPFDITVTNSVPYAQYVEYGTSKMAARNFTNIARFKAELILEQAVSDWGAKCSQVGEIVKPDPIEEVTA